MTGAGWWVVAFLLGGGAVVAWPIGLARRRWVARRAPSPPPHLLPSAGALRLAAVAHARRTVAVLAALAGIGGLVAAGPVAALALGAYAALAARAVLRHLSARQRAALRTRALDDLGALAADLRAGLPMPLSAPSAPDVAGSPSQGRLAAAAPGPDDPRLQELAAAAGRLAERTGAPVADLVDRIEADARAGDRARASVAAQAAGARATAMLLAGLPAGGIALGYAIGADPLRVLLHTPLGAACVAGSLVLQVAGLTWADRLASAGARR